MKTRLLAAILALHSLPACSDRTATAAVSPDAVAPELGLFSSLPIYWGEEDDFGTLLDDVRPINPVRSAFEQDFILLPLDALEADSLASLRRLVLAQPRPLAPSENLALDEWVRAGGEVLVFADPMLTAHSAFGLGDRRRPQDVVLISPILARWGLELRYDEDQPQGRRDHTALGMRIVVDEAGSFALRPGGEASECTLSSEGLIAQCRVGAGRATLIADAAMLEAIHDNEANTSGSLQNPAIGQLLGAAFPR